MTDGNSSKRQRNCLRNDVTWRFSYWLFDSVKLYRR